MGTWLYVTLHHGSTSLYLILLLFTTALLHSIWPYITLPWIYFSLLDSTSFYIGSTSLYFTLFDCTSLYQLPTSFYFTLLYHGSTSLYSTLLPSTIGPLHSTWLYISYFPIALLQSTLLNHGWTSLYMTVRSYHGSASLYLILHYPIMALSFTLCTWL